MARWRRRAPCQQLWVFGFARALRIPDGQSSYPRTTCKLGHFGTISTVGKSSFRRRFNRARESRKTPAESQIRSCYRMKKWSRCETALNDGSSLGKFRHAVLVQVFLTRVKESKLEGKKVKADLIAELLRLEKVRKRFTINFIQFLHLSFC